MLKGCRAVTDAATALTSPTTAGTNPLDEVGECPRPATSMGALSWRQTLALREELESLAHKKTGSRASRQEKNQKHNCRRTNQR